MTSLPGLGTLARRRSSAPRGRAARCQVDDQLARRQLPAVDRRHGHGRGEAPALARSMTSLPGLGTLPAVDRRHHGRHVGTTGTAARCRLDDRLARRRSSARARPREGPGACQVDDQLAELPAVSFPPSIVGTTGTATRCQVDDQLARRQLARRRSSAPRARPREGPGACQVDDQLARTRHACRRRSSAPRRGTSAPGR